MSAIRNEIQFPNRLASLEDEAHRHLIESENQWRLFVAKVQDIKSSKLWHEKTKDWNAYCLSEFGITAATIRQKAAQVPYAELIEAATGHNLTVSKIKSLREIVEDKSIAVEYVYEVAARNLPDGKIPSNAAILATYEAVKESQTGRIELGNEVYEANPVTLDAKVTQAIVDATLRQRDHIASSSTKEKYTLCADGLFKDEAKVCELADLGQYLASDKVNVYLPKRGE